MRVRTRADHHETIAGRVRIPRSANRMTRAVAIARSLACRHLRDESAEQAGVAVPHRSVDRLPAPCSLGHTQRRENGSRRVDAGESLKNWDTHRLRRAIGIAAGAHQTAQRLHDNFRRFGIDVGMKQCAGRRDRAAHRSNRGRHQGRRRHDDISQQLCTDNIGAELRQQADAHRDRMTPLTLQHFNAAECALRSHCGQLRNASSPVISRP